MIAVTNTTADPARPVRVAYVVHTFGTGGLERCTANLCNLLDRSRFHPLVVCLNRNGAASDWIQAQDVRVVELRKRPCNDPKVVLRLARFLHENSVDLVHSQNWGTLIETVLARKLARVRWHVHGEQGLELSDLQLHGLRRLLRTKATRWAFGRATALVAVAESLKRRMVKSLGVPSGKVRVIPNGVESPRALPSAANRARIRRDLGIADTSIVLGSVGRLAPVKDFATAIDSLSELHARGHDVHLILVGDGPEQDKLTKRCVAAAVRERVHLVGRQTNVDAYLAALDIYVNSSVSEGTSLSIMEAMAFGLPLVVTDAGDNARLVNGTSRCGWVVPPRNPVSMADALETLIRDKHQAADFAAAAKLRHAEGFSAEHTTTMYQNLYMSLQNQGARNRCDI